MIEPKIALMVILIALLLLSVYFTALPGQDLFCYAARQKR
jgi:hypothetical protein